MNENKINEKTLEVFLEESKKELSRNKWEDPELFSQSNKLLKRILDGEIKLDKKMK